ncbi:MAG: serine/threonine-protein kinase [Candidatus Micrarchaeota archaeon]
MAEPRLAITRSLVAIDQAKIVLPLPVPEHILGTKIINGNKYSLLKLLSRDKKEDSPTQSVNAEVYLAYSITHQKLVVVKDMSLSVVKDHRIFALAEREINILSQADHVGIPKLIDSYRNQTEQEQYIVMDFVEGKTLKHLIDENVHLDKNQVLSLANQLLDILEYLHSKNPPIVHKDVKPENLIVTPDGKLYLIDFAFVQVRNSTGTTIWAVNNYECTPPEVASGSKRVSASADLYSFGALLGIFLAGMDKEDLKEAIDSGNAPASVRGFEKIIGKCLEVDPKNRYQNAAQVREVLAILVNENVALEPVQKEQETALARIEKLDKEIKDLEIWIRKTGFAPLLLGYVSLNSVIIFIVSVAKNLPITTIELTTLFIVSVILTSLNLFRRRYKTKLKQLQEERKFLQDGENGKFKGMLDPHHWQGVLGSSTPVGVADWSKLDLTSKEIQVHKNLNLEQTLALEKQGLVILPNTVIDTILQNPKLREKYQKLGLFPCRTGTLVDLDGEKCVITQDGKTKEIKLHTKNGWYKQDEFGIPSGKSTNEYDQDARRLWRIEKYSGLLVRYFYGNDFVGQDVGANRGHGVGYGVACVTRQTYEKLLMK